MTATIPRTRITMVGRATTVVRTEQRTTVVDRRPAVSVRVPREVKVTTGRQGPRGRPGTAEGYIHAQGSASMNWVIAHNLGYKPNVELRTVGGVLFDGQVTHVTNNLITVAFAYAIAGTARLL